MIEAAPLVLGLAWGCVAGAPLARRARRDRARRRLHVLMSPAPERGRRAWRWGIVGRVVGGWTRRRTADRADARLRSELPAAIDLVAVAMGAGTPPQAALELSARWAPPQVAAHLRNVLVVTRLGGSLPDALEEMHRTAPPLAGLAEVLVAGARLGAPAVEALGRLSAEVRADERRRLEARTRVLPVKLLFPLVFLVLPAFGLLTVVPALLSALAHL